MHTGLMPPFASGERNYKLDFDNGAREPFESLKSQCHGLIRIPNSQIIQI